MEDKKILKISECMLKIPLARSTLIEHIKKGNIKAEMIKGEHSVEWQVDAASFNEFVDNYNRKIIEKKQYEQELVDKAKIIAPEVVIQGKGKEEVEPNTSAEVKPSPVSTATQKLDETERQLLLEKEKYIELLQERLKAVESESEYLKRQVEYHQQQVEEERNRGKDFAEKYHTSNERTLMLLANLKKHEQQVLEYKQKDAELNERMQQVVDVSRSVIREEIAQGKTTVLAIDDDFDFLNILQTNLGSDNNIALYTADNIYDANKYLVKGIFNVILLDLRLADDNLSGEQYYTQIKSMMSSLSDTKLIIISGESEDRIQSASEQLSAAATMKKPVKIAELKEKIKMLSAK